MPAGINIRKMTEVISVLGCQPDMELITVLFDISEDTAHEFVEEVVESGLFTQVRGRLVLQEVVSPEDPRDLLLSLSVFCYRYLKKLEPDRQLPVFERTVARMEGLGNPPGSVLEFCLQVGDIFFREQILDTAAKIYQFCVYYCQQSRLPDRLFRECVLNLSRADFYRGSNPAETASLQKAAVSMIDRMPPSLEDALLMLYAGLVQHFMGNEELGFQMRQQAIEWMDKLETSSLRHEVVALTGWHIYLSGRFHEAIDYYEDMILDIEYHEDITIATMAYPPIIYSYMFLGEFQRAMILTEIIYRRALKYNDEPTAMIMHVIEGRIYIDSNDNANGADILYEALAECRHKNFIWGQYYALCALCSMHLNQGQIAACHEDVRLMQELRDKYQIGRMYSSPFMLDVLHCLEKNAYPMIPNQNYREELERHILSQNVHMKGASLRHRALLEWERRADITEVLRLLDESIECLRQSGNQLQLGRSYVEKARILQKTWDLKKARESATLAWQALGSHTREYFPNELLELVKPMPLSPDIGASLRSLSMELRFMVNSHSLMLRLLTRLSRMLGVESGSAALIDNDRVEIVAAQSIDQQQKDSAQYQRMMGWIFYAIQNRGIVSQLNKAGDAGTLTADLDSEPAFLLVIPILEKERARCVLYFESSYRTTPFDNDKLEAIREFISEQTPHLLETLRFESDNLAKNETQREEEDIIPETYEGVSEPIRKIMHQIRVVASIKMPVLLTGETGVGKEVYAREIYRISGCRGPFIKVNCGAIPETLLESQLFGYERGSFTGAFKTHQGYFEQADGGTIFLDEIGELSVTAQVALLRVLQEKEITRIGGTSSIPVHFRLIAATNKDLREETELGRFRNDLYFRLNIIPIEIPPLRKRRADLPGLVSYFMKKYEYLAKKKLRISPENMQKLFEYNWPGNIRELENMIQRAIVFSEGDELDFSAIGELGRVESTGVSAVRTLEEVEREYILQILRRCDGKIAGKDGAAELLGLKRTTLLSRMEKLKISPSSLE